VKVILSLNHDMFKFQSLEQKTHTQILNKLECDIINLLFV